MTKAAALEPIPAERLASSGITPAVAIRVARGEEWIGPGVQVIVSDPAGRKDS